MESRDGGARVALALACAAWSSVAGPLPAAAEVVLDGTTGPAGALAGPDFTIPAELGRRAGGNLFHSFRAFNLAHPESATFTGPEGIANVIGRVTGGERSSIDGTLRSIVPGADLWFFNPAGVVFGPNARLDLQGSFHVSTADELRFADGARFSATDPAASFFTVAAPEAFGFLGAESAGISIEESILEVPPGEALSLVGGDLTITGGNSGLVSGGEAGTVRAEAGRVTLAALGGPGAEHVADGEVTADAFADISLTDQALVDASGDGGGTVRIRGGRFVVENQSFAFADNNGPSDAHGGVDVQAEAVSVVAGSRITTDTLGSGAGGSLALRTEELTLSGGGAITAVASNTGAGGSISIDTEQVTLSDRAVLSAETFGAGTGGDVTIRASSQLAVNNGFIGASTSGPADAGSVVIDAGRVEFVNEGRIFNGTDGPGDGGDIIVTADIISADATPLDHEPQFHTGASASANFGSSGRGGDVTVAAREIRLLNGGQISSGTGGTGAGGDIGIHTSRLYANNGFIGSSTSGPAKTADAGSVVIDAGRVEFVNEGRIFNGTDGPGDGGDITVIADMLVADATPLDHEPQFHTGASASANFGSSGQSGRVVVSADSILLKNGGQISSDSDGGGDAGPIEVTAPVIKLLDDGNIASFSTGDGAAGSISIVAAQRLFLDEGFITTVSDNTGGGRITFKVGELLELRDGSEISSSVFGGADTTAGNITIDPRFLVLDDSSILAQANEGTGGSIDIVADNILRSPGSRIDASSRLGIDGTVSTSAPEVDLTGRLAVLEGVFLDAASQLRKRCGERRGGGTGSFTGMGRGGVGVGPDGPLPGFYADLIGPGPAAAASPGRDMDAAIAEAALGFAPATLVTGCGARG